MLHNKRTSPKVKNLSTVISFSILFLYLFLVFLKPIELGDFWWHLSSGRHMTEHFEIPTYDPFSATENSIPWTYTQWLGSLAFLGLYQWGGLGLLPFFRSSLFLLIFFLFYLHAKNKMPRRWLMLLILFISGGLLTRTQLRPYLFNFLFIQVLFLCFAHFKQTGHSKILLWLPLISIIWINLHLGAFYYAAIIFFCFFAEAVLARINIRMGKKEDPFYSQQPLIIPKYLFIFFIYYICFLFNPYGVQGAVYPLRVFFDPQFINLHQFNAFILEQQPPTYLFTWKGGWFFALSFLYLFTLKKSQKRPLANILLFISSLFLFLYSQRMSAFFAIITGYLIVDNYSRYKLNPDQSTNSLTQTLRKTFTFLLIIGLILFSIRIINKNLIVQGQTKRHITTTLHAYSPQQTVDLLLKSKINGTVFNFDRYGGYLLWHSYPQLRPFVDGRQLDKKAWEAYRLIVSFPNQFWSLFEEEYKFSVAMIDVKAPFGQKITRHLIKHKNWSLISIEGITFTFVRNDVLQEIKVIEPLSDLKKVLQNKEKLPSFLTKRLEQEGGKRNILKTFLFPHPYYVDQMQERALLLKLGYPE